MAYYFLGSTDLTQLNDFSASVNIFTQSLNNFTSSFSGSVKSIIDSRSILTASFRITSGPNIIVNSSSFNFSITGSSTLINQLSGSVVLVAGPNITINSGSGIISISGTSTTFSIKQTEIDFTTTASRSSKFQIIDSSVSPSSNIIANQAMTAPSGKSQDENEMDYLICRCVSTTGSFTLFINSTEGPVRDKFKINYVIG